MTDHAYVPHPVWPRDQCEYRLHDPNDENIGGICGMPRSAHPEEAHVLRIQLATVLRERDEALADIKSICVALGWGDVPPLDSIERDIRSLRIAFAAASARADAAVAEIVNEQRRFGEVQAEAWRLEEALAAARRECEGLTSSVVHLRLVGMQMATFIEEQMPLFGGVSSEFDGEGEPREILKRWRKADKIADKSYSAALAAPGVTSGEEK